MYVTNARGQPKMIGPTHRPGNHRHVVPATGPMLDHARRDPLCAAHFEMRKYDDQSSHYTALRARVARPIDSYRFS